METIVVATYKGIDIHYSPNRKMFSIEEEGETGSYTTQDGAEKRIDALGKTRMKKIKVFWLKWGETVYISEVTSYNPDTQELWITDKQQLWPDDARKKDLRRHKESVRFGGIYAYKATAKNVDIVAQIIEKRKEKARLDEIIKELERGLEKQINVELMEEKK